ncbi:MAG: hypothetical protein KKG59_07195 [Nanoarchaeota archaeon]|nr:hypothetical protein [Nanoarchaeota archaeon]
MLTGLLILIGFCILLVLAVVLKALKIFLKVVMYAGIAFGLFLLVTGIMVFQDADDFKAKFPNSPKKFLLVNDGIILAGMGSQGTTPPTVLEAYDLGFLQEDYAKGRLDLMLVTDYKLIIFDMSNFDSVQELTLNEINITLNRSEIELALINNSAVEILSRKMYEPLEEDVKEQISFEQFKEGMWGKMQSNEQIKVTLFAMMIQKVAGIDMMPFLVTGMRKGTILIYPKTFMFKAIQYVPEGVMKNAMESRE